MTIRTEHNKDHPFIQISKAITNDKSLKLEDRGFLMFLLSKPDTWDLDVYALSKEMGLHFTTIYRLLKNLIGTGYMTKSEIKRCTTTGRFQTGVIYTVYEKKQKPTTKDAKILGKEVPF